MPNTDLDSLITELKEAALKATPPQWIVDKNNRQVWSTRNTRVLFDFRNNDDGAYIALACPANILRILEDRERLLMELESLRNVQSNS